MRLAEGDKRLGFVTFVATLAANIATVVVVALAVSSNDAENELGKLLNPRPGHSSWNIPWWAFAAFFALGVVVVWVGVSPRMKRIRDSWPVLILTLGVGLLCVLVVIIMALGVLGSLAGVR